MTEEDVEILGLNTHPQEAILKHSLQWFFWQGCSEICQQDSS